MRGTGAGGPQVKIAQRKKQFEPRVSITSVDSAVDFPNFDRVFHNVFSLSTPKEFDLGLYRKGKSKSVRFAHPGLVSVAREEFDRAMPQPNQIDRQRDDIEITAEDLLAAPEGTITEDGVRTNVRVGIQYMEAWLRGSGCVPLYNLMEDAATAEISRTQLWQWIHHPKGVLDDGREITMELYRQILDEEMKGLKQVLGEAHFSAGKYARAAQLFNEIISNDELEEFLTLRAYEDLD